MDMETITKAAGVIQARTGGIGGGFDGYATLALIDENGYPTASTATISKADGIKWITFLTSVNSNKAKRIRKCGKGSVCLSSPKYNITLVGTLEILTDLDTKREMWYDAMGEIMSGPDDPAYCVLRFRTERYNIFFADSGKATKGNL